jgi:hypothetical protein
MRNALGSEFVLKEHVGRRESPAHPRVVVTDSAATDATTLAHDSAWTSAAASEANWREKGVARAHQVRR